MHAGNNTVCPTCIQASTLCDPHACRQQHCVTHMHAGNSITGLYSYTLKMASLGVVAAWTLTVLDQGLQVQMDSYNASGNSVGTYSSKGAADPAAPKKVVIGGKKALSGMSAPSSITFSSGAYVILRVYPMPTKGGWTLPPTPQHLIP